jgi:pimeloyl-ACP methyl ester carboxylesterase
MRLAMRRVRSALLLCAVVVGHASGLEAQERVSFPTVDEGVVSADLWGSGSRGVVLVHGGRFDRSSWEGQAPVLADVGFRVLAIDLRGRGESRAGTMGPDALALDVLAAVRYLRETGTDQVAVLGASLGGWAAAEAVIAAEPGEIDAVVLLAHSPIAEPERLTGRKLFIVSREDTSGSGAPRLIAIRDQYDRAPEPKELVVLEGSAHAQFLFETDQRDRLLGEILRFLSLPTCAAR